MLNAVDFEAMVMGAPFPFHVAAIALKECCTDPALPKSEQYIKNEKEQEVVVKRLIKSGADVNAINDIITDKKTSISYRAGVTPLHIAAALGHNLMIKA